MAHTLLNIIEGSEVLNTLVVPYSVNVHKIAIQIRQNF